MSDLTLTADEFDDDARAMIAAAQQDARTLGHGYVGTEHLLLAATRAVPELRAGLAAHQSVDLERLTTELQRVVAENPEWLRYIPDDDALAAIGVDRRAVRDRAREEFGELFTAAPEGPGFTVRAARTLDAAAERANAAGHRARPQDIARSVLAESEGVACRVLARLDVDATVLLV
jgi:ATP-dependent Clp protease ATP-binding subunit ClpA